MYPGHKGFEICMATEEYLELRASYERISQMLTRLSLLNNSSCHSERSEESRCLAGARGDKINNLNPTRRVFRKQRTRSMDHGHDTE